MVANWKQNLLTDWVSYKSFNGHAVSENCLLAARKKNRLTYTIYPKHQITQGKTQLYTEVSITYFFTKV